MCFFKTVDIQTAARILQRACVFILVSAAPLVARAQFTYTSINGTMTITGYTGPGGSVSIPGLVNGVPVTGIADHAFDVFLGNTGPSSVTIPDSVAIIGSYVFSECLELTNVAFGNGVVSIGSNVFTFCPKLSAIAVGALNPSFSSLDGVLFNKDQSSILQSPPAKTGSYSIPNTVTTIGNNAFGGCSKLTSITIPNTVTNIGDYAFQLCAGLTNLALPSRITSIGNSVFFSCTSLTNIVIPESVTSIGDVAFEACSSLTNITIPRSVTSIGKSAFDLCTGLLKVAIPNSVTTIGDAAFYSCESLTTVTIGNSVTNIASRAFHDCPSLEGLYFAGNAPDLGTNVFEFDNNAIVYYLPGTQGWGPTFGGLPTVLWNPQMQLTSSSVGMQTNQFGFSITGSANIIVVVEACTNLANPNWQPLQTNSLSSASVTFSDPQSRTYSARFYRLRSP